MHANFFARYARAVMMQCNILRCKKFIWSESTDAYRADFDRDRYFAARRRLSSPGWGSDGRSGVAVSRQHDEFLCRRVAVSAAGTNEARFACLAVNRRGHDVLSIRNSRAAEGAAVQLTCEGIADNRYAAD